MPHYRVHNGELSDLLSGGMERPKLRLILRAGARAKTAWERRVVDDFRALYRNVDEGGLRLSDAQIPDARKNCR